MGREGSHGGQRWKESVHKPVCQGYNAGEGGVMDIKGWEGGCGGRGWGTAVHAAE